MSSSANSSAGTDPDGLTPQQQDKLRTFQEVTSAQGHFDRSSAIQILRSCNWSLEQAVQVYLATIDEEAGIRHPIGSTGGLGAPLLDASQVEPEVSSPARARGSQRCCQCLHGNSDREHVGSPAAADDAGRAGIMDWLSAGFRRLSASVVCLVRAFVFGAGRAGTGLGLGGPVSGRALQQSIAQVYGPGLELPQFVDCTFTEAVSSARQQLKLLVVYLHSAISPQTPVFVRDILGKEFVRTMLDDSFVLWAGDIARGETHVVAMTVHALETPCLAVILPRSLDEMRVLEMLTGDLQPDQVVARLVSCLDHMDAHRAELMARAEQQTEDRLLREQQDLEYQEALEMDRLRIEEEERQTQERKKQEEEARKVEEEAKAEAEKKEQERLAIIEGKKSRAAAFGGPPPEASASISLRLPAGQRVQRKFLPTATLEEVYQWAELVPFLPENEGKQLLVPDRFVLKSNFPSRDLVEKEQTVEALKLAGTNILLAAIEDDDDEPEAQAPSAATV